MYEFTYHKPGSIKEVQELLKQAKDGTVMSGGMTLLPTLKQKLANPSDVIDLAGLGNSGITVSGGMVNIKAGTCHSDVAASRDIQKAIPALANLAGQIGDIHVRNRGTIGGSVANNDPAADYPAACLGLNATIKTDKREIAAGDFFLGLFETALQEGEIITEISFPVPERGAYSKFPNPASRYALVGVFVAQTAEGVRVAVTGASECVFRAAEMETALAEKFSSDQLDAIAVSADGLNSDLHADADYRAHLVGVMAKRAVEAAG